MHPQRIRNLQRTNTLSVILVAFIILMTVVIPARADIRIVQVLYDPIGTESGGEFVQLSNDGNASVDISAWVLATGASLSDVVIPDGTILSMGKRFLIADKGWKASRDNSSWPLADLEDTMTLANVNSGVALLQNGTIVDAVGWGNVSSPTLFRGHPAGVVGKGEALRRIAFTGSNDQDFVEGAPSFTASDPKGGIEVIVDVTGQVVSVPMIVGLEVEDDDPRPGVQLIPFPGATRQIGINVSIEGSGIDEWLVESFSGNTTLSLNIPLNKTTALSNNRLFTSLPFDTLPGTHPLSVSARRDGVVVANRSVVVEVQPVMAISIDAPSIPAGNISPGSTVIIRGDEDLSTVDRPTIWNAGNVKAGLTILGTDLSGGSSQAPARIPVSAVQVSLVRSNKPLDSMMVSSLAQEAGIRLGVHDRAAIDVAIQIPQVPAGRYSGRLWLLASSGE